MTLNDRHNYKTSFTPFPVEKARVFDPFGHAGFDPSGKIRLTPKKSWRRGSTLFYLI